MKEDDSLLMRYFILWLFLLFMVALSFNGIFRIGENLCENTCYQFFAIISFALLPSSRFNIHVCFRLLCQTPFIEMPSLNRNEKVTFENCGTQTTKLNLARQLEHCIVHNVPLSPQNPETIWITILLRSIAPQNLISPSSVNFAFKTFQDFTLDVNIETLNTGCRSDQEQETWMWNM